MSRVRLSRRAQVVFDEIIANLSDVAEPGIAARYARDIRASINRLAHLTHIGPPRRELGPSIRISIVAPYLITCDPNSFGAVVQVFRILHGSRNIARSLLGAGE